MYCHHCGDDCAIIKDADKGFLICATCGRVIDQEIFSDEPTFIKGNDGQSRLAGNFMRSIQNGYSASHERTSKKGFDEISYIASGLNMSTDETIHKAYRFYQIALDRNFTKGRRTSHVAASCLYIACRKEKKDFLLIDFAEHLHINVYVLGAVFLQLCQILQLSEHPIVQKLVDPSLFIHRFTSSLLGKPNAAITQTAMRIVASMKRDWMQTGRNPSGLCGAALYISALSHGLDFSKSDVVSVVRVCEQTLTKRLIEFENTESGSLTIEEFLVRANEVEQELALNDLPKFGTLLCKHKDLDVEHFAHGLCRKCYNKFMKLSGGLDGSAEPPAFQRAERERMMIAAKVAKEMKDIGPGFENTQGENHYMCVEFPRDENENEISAHEVTAAHDGSLDQNGSSESGTENFSDIDDAEVETYINDPNEKHCKTIIWEEMNRDYLEEQALKEAVADAERALKGFGEPKKERKRRRLEENTEPPQTPFEATCNVLKRKGFAAKINLEAVGELYETPKDGLKECDAGFDDDDMTIGEDAGNCW